MADYLSEKHGASVILTSAPSESEVLREVAKHASRTHHYWPDLGLEELFALIRGVRLFIGNDSGPTHAAAALVRPIVVVWGSSNFFGLAPMGHRLRGGPIRFALHSLSGIQLRRVWHTQMHPGNPGR